MLLFCLVESRGQYSAIFTLLRYYTFNRRVGSMELKLRAVAMATLSTRHHARRDSVLCLRIVIPHAKQMVQR